MNESYKTPLGYSIPINIRVVTPIHIGSPDTLSPLTDYYLANGKAHILDADRLSELLLEKDQIEGFLDGVERVTEQDKTGFLKSFCTNNLKVDFEELPVKFSYDYFGVTNPVEIQLCVRSDGHPFVPGSSLKGAVRSALLYNWLSEGSVYGSKVASERSVSNWWQRFDSIYNDAELKNKRNRQVQEIMKAFTREIEEQFFGRLNSNERLALSCLKVTDSEKLDNLRMSIYGTTRFNLQSGKDGIPVLKECIAPQKLANLKVNLDYNHKINQQEIYNPVIKPLTDITTFFKVINQYSLAVLEYEYDAIQNHLADNIRLEEYAERLGELKQNIEDAGERKAFLRLGQGKMMFYQTIALALFKHWGSDEDQEDWVKYLFYCTEFKDENITDPYPVTRDLTTHKQMPLGWVELSLG